LAVSALLFFKPLEDAYVLPQRLGLGLAALGLMAGCTGADLPRSALVWLGLGLFAWRCFCHAASPSLPPTLPWLAVQLPECALFVGAAAALRDPALRRKAAVFLIAAGALGAAFALLAPLGLDPFSGGAVDLGFGRRAHGTLGNPDFLGGWLAMLLPAALLAAARGAGWGRRLAALSAALIALALALTLARGAWLAAAAGCCVAAAASGIRPGWRPLLLGGAVVVAAFFTVVALGSGQAGLAGRLKEGADLGSDAWGSRAFMASVALDLARERPWTGVGGGAFEMEYLRRQGERLRTDLNQPFRLTADAHNDWIQAAAETGFPGLLLWLTLFTLALRAAWRHGGAEGGAVAGALAAFGVQGCFHFPWDIVPSAGLLLLCLGAAAALQSRASWTPPAAWPWPAAVAVLACLGLGLHQAGASALLNSGTAVQADPATRVLAVPLLRGAAALDPEDERAWSRLGGAQMARGDAAGAVGSFQRALQALPSAGDDWTNLGLCLAQTGRLPGAEAALRQAVALNPRSNEAWSDEANAVYQLGRPDEALALARQGIAEAGGSAQAWFNLGGILFNLGRRAEAAPAFAQALRLQPGYPQALDLLERCRHAS
jgi:tetratricopeptide (TPR) repeat protein